ncbi:MAG: type II toxin-antitoxin system RelE/ParE family toxin [Thermodesulfobacteriota bacterium]
MIKDFKDRNTEEVFNRRQVKSLPPDIQRTALRKLRMLDAATTLSDLRNPPGNKLKKMERERKGQFSIRINDQWRICFVWENGDAHDVEIADVH